MLASLFDPRVQRGGTFSIGITAVDENDSAMDFSVYDSMRMQVRPAWVGKPGTIKGDPLLSLSTEGVDPTIVVATTVITITLPAAVTETLTFNSGKYELEMVIDAVGETPEIVDKLLYGTMYITGEIVV